MRSCIVLEFHTFVLSVLGCCLSGVSHYLLVFSISAVSCHEIVALLAIVILQPFRL